MKIVSLSHKMIFREIIPSACGLVFAFSFSFFLKVKANGGPILSDEWGYLGPTRNFLVSDSPISNAGNHLYALLILLITDTSPLSGQLNYFYFNLAVFFSILISFCILINHRSLRTKIFACSVLSLSGNSLFISTLMPELLSILLSLISLILLRYFSAVPKVSGFFLTLIIFLGPFVKLHLALLSLSIVVQFISMFFKGRKQDRIDLSLSIFLGTCASLLLLFLTINRNSHSSYLGIQSTRDISMVGILNLLLLTISSISMICLISGRLIFSLKSEGVGDNERIFIRTYTFLSISTFTFFSWSAASLGPFEANRLHGRYYLPLIFLLLTYVFGFRPQSLDSLRINCAIAFISVGYLLISSATFLNIYPWDVPFLFGLYGGQTPWGWQLGTVSPLFVSLLLFLFLVFPLCLVPNTRHALQNLYTALMLALVLSSSLGVSQWVVANGEGISGEAIDWALSNPQAECYPRDFPEFVVHSNMSVSIPRCV